MGVLIRIPFRSAEDRQNAFYSITTVLYTLTFRFETHLPRVKRSSNVRHQSVLPLSGNIPFSALTFGFGWRAVLTVVTRNQDDEVHDSGARQQQKWCIAVESSTHDCLTTQTTDAVAAFDDAGLHDGNQSLTVLQNRDIGHQIAIDDEHVAQFSDRERS